MPSNHKFLSNLSDTLPEIPPDSIISHTVYKDNNKKVILFGFSPEQELSEHTASKPAILHILDGEAQVTLGEDNYDAGGGSWIHLDSNVPHRIFAQTELTMLLILFESIDSK